jgi:aminopeptidase YwaD
LSNPRTRITRHLRALAGPRHPDSAPEALRNAARYLATQFTRSGWATTRQPFQAWGKTYRNIVAIRNPRGWRTKESPAPLLIGAHYDTVESSPGGDDNASGLVVLLEVARRLRRAALHRPVWLAAFCLEEENLLGSRAFASRLRRTGGQLAGAIILECVGYASCEAGSQQIPPGVPIAVPTVGNFLAIIGNDESQPLVAAVEQSARQAVPTLKTLGLAVPGRGEVLPDVRRSDHAAFWDEGFPAVMLTDTANFRNPHYHQPTDTLETLNLGFLEDVVEAVAASVKTLAERSEK